MSRCEFVAPLPWPSGVAHLLPLLARALGIRRRPARRGGKSIGRRLALHVWDTCALCAEESRAVWSQQLRRERSRTQRYSAGMLGSIPDRDSFIAFLTTKNQRGLSLDLRGSGDFGSQPDQPHGRLHDGLHGRAFRSFHTCRGRRSYDSD
jgi:hypothetical protein